jgi:DNA-directed RNA polymerase subunit beta
LFFITADQEELSYTFGISEIILNTKKVLSQYNQIRQKKIFVELSLNEINFINPKVNQIISIGTSLIPFIEHNDANRALMGSNMQRQALPLLYKETPIVGTKLINVVGKNSSFTISAKKSGFVEFTSFKKIIVREEIGKKLNLLLTKNQLLKKKLIKKLKYVCNNYTQSKYKKRYYYLKEPRRSNQNTLIKQMPIVKKNEWVIKGQTIVDTNSTHNGLFSIGKNIFIGYLCWNGYNFEDAIIINEKIVENNTFTSIHIKKYKTFVINNETEKVRV